MKVMVLTEHWTLVHIRDSPSVPKVHPKLRGTVGGGWEEHKWCFRQCLSVLQGVEEERGLWSGPHPQACQGTGVGTTGSCGLIAGALEGQLDGLWLGPLTL
jgi:hypothetical protein